jgi:uncharacterized protein with PQ loop repeat
LAGGLATASLVPQVAKIWKTKSAEDVSLTMFVVFCVGVVSWLAYGAIKQGWRTSSYENRVLLPFLTPNSRQLTGRVKSRAELSAIMRPAVISLDLVVLVFNLLRPSLVHLVFDSTRKQG